MKEMQSANLSGPLKGLRPYHALLGLSQASGLAGGFDSELFFGALSRFQLLDKGRNLGDHVVHVLKHGALGGAQAAGLVDMPDHLLILILDLVEELAEHRQLLLGRWR